MRRLNKQLKHLNVVDEGVDKGVDKDEGVKEEVDERQQQYLQ